MLQDTALLLHTIYNYIRDFHGSIAQAYQFPHACQKPLVLEDIPPYLLCRLTADTYLFHIDEPIRSILILLDGTCCVEKYSHLGHLYTDTTRSAIQIFGLIEAVTNQPRHSVSIGRIPPNNPLQSGIDDDVHAVSVCLFHRARAKCRFAHVGYAVSQNSC